LEIHGLLLLIVYEIEMFIFLVFVMGLPLFGELTPPDKGRGNCGAEEVSLGVFLALKVGLELLISALNVFRNDPCFTYYGHETSVAVPPRDNMPVVMVGYPCSGYFSQIESDVESIRFIDQRENLDAFLY